MNRMELGHKLDWLDNMAGWRSDIHTDYELRLDRTSVNQWTNSMASRTIPTQLSTTCNEWTSDISLGCQHDLLCSIRSILTKRRRPYAAIRDTLIVSDFCGQVRTKK